MKLDPYKQDIAEALAAGTSQRNIAKTYGVDRTTVSKFIDRHKLAVAPPEVAVKAEGPSREEILDAEVRELRAAMRKGRKATVAEERILLAIERALEEAPPLPPALPLVPSEPGTKARHRQVVLLSDFHGGEVVDRDAVNGMNSYDWGIMVARVDQVVEGLLSHKQHSPALTGLDIGFLGDMCSGANHDEITVTNDHPLAEQAVKMGYLLGQTVERLIPHYPDIQVFGCVGNHPRFVKAPAAKEVWNNGDWVAYKIAEQYLAPYGVVCNFPRAAALIHEVAGRNVFVFHGDGIKTSMPGVPWGGVMRRMNGTRVEYMNRGVKIDDVYIGHFHQANAMVDLGIYMNGALKGTDEWCRKSGFSASDPTQLLLTYDEKHSRLTDVKFLNPRAGL